MTDEDECDKKAPDAGNVQGQYKSGGSGKQVKDSLARCRRQSNFYGPHPCAGCGVISDNHTFIGNGLWICCRCVNGGKVVEILDNSIAGGPPRNQIEVYTGEINAPGTTEHGRRGVILVRSLGELGTMLSFAILDDGKERS